MQSRNNPPVPLVVASTAMEILPFIERHRKRAEHSPDILITGVGMLATTYNLSSQLKLKTPSVVIQVGLAGSLDPSLEIGQVYAVKKEVIADQSVMENDQLLTVFELGLENANDYPYKKGFLPNPHNALLKLSGVKPVNGLSVNHISTSPVMISQFRKKFKADVESMEGAALHYVCLRENLPFVQLRAVSNYAGERDKQKWKIRESVRELNRLLECFMDKI